MVCRQLNSLQFSIGVLLFCLYLPLVHAQDYPGADDFTYQCQPDSVIFYYQGSSVIHATLARITQAISSAASVGRNQLIAATSQIGLWALTTRELQIHLNNDAEATKLVLPANICGAGTQPQPPSPPDVTTIPSQTAIAIAQSDANGSAVAVAIVMPNGVIVAYAETIGSATAIAIAQSTGTNTGTNSVYIVQRGDTLYSIARRYNTTVATLATLNNISDPNAIFEGQQLILP
jgi:hypothetical protein